MRDLLSEYIFTSKYALYRPEDKRRETYSEAVERMFSMHYKKFPDLTEDLDHAKRLVLEKRILPSMRAMQYGGKPIEKNNTRMYNCAFSYIDRPEVFQESFHLLLCGTGTGFSVQKHHVAKLPPVQSPSKGVEIHQVADSIEGWADALGALVQGYFLGGPRLVFDYNLVRPEGSPISSCSGKAPGPAPLERAIESCRTLLDRCSGGKLRPIDAYDLLMFSTDAVLSGGVRRSACIALFSHDDKEMREAKIGNWFEDNPQRGRSNNTAVLKRGETSEEEFLELIECTKEFGEPGFLWVDDLEHGTNPCCEIGLRAYDEEGNSGWQFCNLTEINMAKIECLDDFRDATLAAAILGTVQASYTDFPYLGAVSENITKREALLGISLTGIMACPWELGTTAATLQQMAHVAIRTNESVAQRIGVNPAARVTCVKPSGTASLLLGTSSGVHPEHSARYIRRVQANPNEEPAKFFQAQNKHAVEPSVWREGDWVLSFAVKAHVDAKTRQQVNAQGLLQEVLKIKRAWVDAGRVAHRCVDPTLSHNVSNTVTLQPDDWFPVADTIFENQEHLSGVSLLSATGDVDYPQAPFTQVFRLGQLEYDFGERLIQMLQAEKRDPWGPKEAFEALAKLYTQGDVQRVIQCAKYLEALEQYNTLLEQQTPVDYADLTEEEDNTTIAETVACGGGGCELGPR